MMKTSSPTGIFNFLPSLRMTLLRLPLLYALLHNYHRKQWTSYVFAIFADMARQVGTPAWQWAWKGLQSMWNDLFTPVASLPLLVDVWAPHVSFVFNLQPSPEAERLDGERALAVEGGGATH